MTLTPIRIALGLAMLTIAALLLLSTRTEGASGSEPLAKSKSCGTHKSDSIYPKGKVTAIRGVGCREALKVAKKFRPRAQGRRQRLA